MQSKQKKIEQKDREIDDLKQKLDEKDKAPAVVNSIDRERLT